MYMDSMYMDRDGLIVGTAWSGCATRRFPCLVGCIFQRDRLHHYLTSNGESLVILF